MSRNGEAPTKMKEMKPSTLMGRVQEALANDEVAIRMTVDKKDFRNQQGSMERLLKPAHNNSARPKMEGIPNIAGSQKESIARMSLQSVNAAGVLSTGERALPHVIS
jgi:hypothetical protein